MCVSAQVLFGKLIPADDFQPVAVAVPLVAYKAKKDNEISFTKGQKIRVLASRAFVRDGYWLGQDPSAPLGYGLIPITMVEVHDHEFGNLRDFDDDLHGSRVSGAGGSEGG